MKNEMKEQSKLKTKEDIIEYIKEYINYRGGMFNRITALDILRHLEGKDKRHYKMILKFTRRNKND